MNAKHTLLAALLACMALAGCSSLSGVGGESEYACKAPDGVPCMSMDGVYANVRQGNLPDRDTGQMKSKDRGTTKDPGTSGFPPRGDVAIASPPTLATAATAQPGAYGAVSPGMMNAPTSGMPLRTPERILRMWVAAIEDADGVLHDQRYMYVPIERGRWQIETFLEAGARAYEPVTRVPSREPPARTSATSVDGRTAANVVAQREASNQPFRPANPSAPTPAANRPGDYDE
jgi:conjugal transfer pilus assembly protein TraV